MGIIEIWLPELIIVIFLALPLFRPFFKVLWSLDGLVWLPIISLALVIGIFPAYGFRPECLPMLVFTFFFNLANLPSFSASVASRHNDSFRDRGPLLTALALILLGAVTVPMFAFSSRVGEKPENETNVKVVKITNRILNSAGAFNREYSLLIYGETQVDRPLIFLVPPELGSAASIDLVCTELQKRDFTVVTYSFKDTYISHKKASLIPEPFKYWRMFKRGTDLVSVNEQGKIFESEQRAEIEFLMSRLPAALGYANERPPILLAGYGAGGSALTYLAGENNFANQYGNVLGVVAIESQLWSSYLPDSGSPAAKAYGGMASRQRAGIASGVKKIMPKKVIRTGSLPAVRLPVLYVVSGKALETPKGQKPYQAIFNAVQGSTVSDPLSGANSRIALAAIEGAGPLDYQDFPFTHPIYSFLLPGLKDAEKSEYPIGDTASIIGNFMSLLMASSADPDTEEIDPAEAATPNRFIPPRYAISGKLYVESKGFPGFRL